MNARRRAQLFGLALASRFVRRRGRAGSSLNEAVTRILVVELWNIGDVILALPFLNELRSVFPNAEITLLCRSHASAILANTGVVDELIHVDGILTQEREVYRPFDYDWKKVLDLFRDLRKRHLDIAFVSRMHVREHAIAMFSGAARTVG